MNKMAGKGLETTSLILNVSEGREEIRAEIFSILGEFDFYDPKGTIEVRNEDVERIVEMVRAKFPDLEIKDGVAAKIITRKRTSVSAVAVATTTQDQHSNETPDYVTTSDQWAEFRRNVQAGWELARQADRPSKDKKWPKYRIRVEGYSFIYRGKSMGITNGDDSPVTLAQLQAWRRRVNRELKFARKNP